MNAFEKKLSDAHNYPLKAEGISTLQINIGYKCNLTCTHCHVDASPHRNEQMSSRRVDKIIDILEHNSGITTVDITGGSPEYNPDYRRLIIALAEMGKNVIVRSNLAVLTEPGMEDVPALWAEHKVRVVASLPCYTENGVDSQRGKGTYKKAIAMLKHLNELGYGQEGSGLEIDLMFNPAGEGIAPDQRMLENAYKEKLSEMHGIVFNHLIALSNMPIGRLGKGMSIEKRREYLEQLEKSFNPETVRNLMCRHLISVAPDGTLYDCDFWQMLKLPVKDQTANDIDSFDYEKLCSREILTAPLCFMCTAGAGASCSGALS